MDEDIKKNILKTGTTILGIVCKDGIVMAGDRRGTLGQSLIYSKENEKVRKITDYLVYSGCGSAAEIQKVEKILPAHLRLNELKSRSRPSVKESASLLSNIQVQMSAFLLAGFDEDGSISLYEITGGYLRKVNDYSASVGSGMPYVLGLLERQWKPNLSIKEGIELAKEALKSSTQRDSASGNGIDVYTITKDKIEKVVSQTIEPSYNDQDKKK